MTNQQHVVFVTPKQLRRVARKFFYRLRNYVLTPETAVTIDQLTKQYFFPVDWAQVLPAVIEHGSGGYCDQLSVTEDGRFYVNDPVDHRQIKKEQSQRNVNQPAIISVD